MTAVPFIVTTKRPLSCTCWGRVEAEMCRACRKGGKDVSRRAVATLEEARQIVLDFLEFDIAAEQVDADMMDAQYRYAEALPESGGTVGPLPDGTVIEVERVSWHDLTHHAPNVGRFWLPATGGDEASRTAILDAFNAREAGAKS